MDLGAIKAFLDSQERAYRSAMDIVTDQFKKRISSLENTVSDLTRSLEFTQAEVDELKQTIKEVKRDCQKNKTIIEAQEKQISEAETSLNYQEDYSRRNNLRLNGVSEQDSGETWKQTATIVSNIFTDKLQLPGIALERAHRVGQPNPQRPRPIVVRFERYCDREAVVRNARKLRGTQICINEDLCPASQAIRTSQLPELKQARAQGKIAFFKYTRLIIKERTRQQPINQNNPPTGEPTHEPSNASTTGDADLVHGNNLPHHGLAVGVTSGGAAVGVMLDDGSSAGGSSSDDVEQWRGGSVIPAIGRKAAGGRKAAPALAEGGTSGGGIAEDKQHEKLTGKAKTPGASKQQRDTNEKEGWVMQHQAKRDLRPRAKQ